MLLAFSLGNRRGRHNDALGLQIASWTWGAVQSEHDLYRRMVSKDPGRQQRALAAFEDSFAILGEARLLMHCLTLQGVVRLEGVCVAKEPCRRVTGLLLEYFPKGDLQNVVE